MTDHRQLGVDLFNEVWRLLETREDDERMVHAAHASAYHWSVAPECRPENRARSEWQCSRVYAVLGRAEAALHHARRCLDVCERHGIGDFDLAFAHEALARAYAVAGDGDASGHHAELAKRASESIAEADDRELLLADLASLPPASPAP